jgi:hypothetical protein
MKFLRPGRSGFTPRFSVFNQASRRKAAPTVWFILAIAVGMTHLPAQDYGNNKPPPTPAVSVPLTPEQKTQLEAIDVRIAGVEGLLPKIDDEKYKTSIVSAIADLKRRRKALEKNFDPMTYESLMQQVIGRYQVVALWLKPPRVPAPAAPAAK